jgi:DNA polymerase-1
MLKIAMINIDQEMTKRKLKSKMILQVHDELVFDVVQSELEELRELVIDKMRTALPLGDVPVVVDTGTGINWFEAH